MCFALLFSWLVNVFSVFLYLKFNHPLVSWLWLWVSRCIVIVVVFKYILQFTQYLSQIKSYYPLGGYMSANIKSLFQILAFGVPADKYKIQKVVAPSDNSVSNSNTASHTHKSNTNTHSNSKHSRAGSAIVGASKRDSNGSSKRGSVIQL